MRDEVERINGEIKANKKEWKEISLKKVLIVNDFRDSPIDILRNFKCKLI